jgi:hypothetical protein
MANELEAICFVLDRIAVALEQLSAAHGAQRSQDVGVKAAPVKDKPPFTLAQLKTISDPFKADNQLGILKGVLKELGVAKLSDLTDRKLQDQYLVIVKDKCGLIASGNIALNAINILTKE